jgi:hypothetical protein
MTAATVIERAGRMGVTMRVHTDGQHIWAGPADRVTEDLAGQIRAHKLAIIAELSSLPGATSRCVQHVDPTTWQDAPDPKRKGWLRTRCVRCGGFVGYRPETN